MEAEVQLGQESVFEARRERVCKRLKEAGLEQMIVIDPLSIWYLSGYYTEPMERFLALILNCSDPRHGSSLLVNKLFPQPQLQQVGCFVHDDTQDPLTQVAELLDPTKALGVDKVLPAKWLLPLLEGKVVPEAKIASFAVDVTRACKDELEQELMRQASVINDQAMEWLCQTVRVGMSERELAAELLEAYRRLGADDFSFDPIVSFGGSNCADPHHEPDGTRLEAGMEILFDVGCKAKGYCSDMTRTFFSAKPTSEEIKVYDAVHRANEAAEKLVRAGVAFCDLDRAARSVIEDAGYGQYFTHRLGHSIGASCHETGDVSAANTDLVQPGMCFSIEPGIYIPHVVGVRIEDLVIAGENGAEILNSYSKELKVLKI